MTTYEGYFDESGSFDEAPGVFCVSGYFVESEAARVMAKKWVVTLAEYGLPYFHMVDCAHGSGIFSTIDKAKRIELVTRLIALIKEYTLSGFSSLLHVDQFIPTTKRPDAYVAGAQMCVGALLSYLQVQKMEGEISYFFESGHSSQGLAYQRIAKELEKTSSSVRFASKTEVPLLQAADLLAWQSTKYVKDSMTRARPMRADFASLMEHQHSLTYLRTVDHEPTIAFEDWPLSRRSKRSVVLTAHTDGPIEYVCEDDDPTPIIMIDDPLGWQEGGGKLIQVYFSSMGGKKFALAFDEPRLRQTIMALTHVLEQVKPGKTED